MSHSTEIFDRRTLLWFRNITVRKIFFDKRGLSGSSAENFLSQSTGTFLSGTLQCFSKFPVSKNFKTQKGGSAYQEFPSEMLCLTVSILFVQQPFFVSDSSWYWKIIGIRKVGAYRDSPSEKFSSHSTGNSFRWPFFNFKCLLISKVIKDKRGGGTYHLFPLRVFRLRKPKKFEEATLCVSEKLWCRKFLWRRGGFITKKFRRGIIQCFRNIRYGNIFKDERGLSRDPVEIVLSHSTGIFRSGTHWCFRSFLRTTD